MIGGLDRYRRSKPARCRFTHSLIIIPEAANTFTAEELLDALKERTDSVDGRNLVVGLIARRFSDDPKVTAYYFSRLSAGERAALSDIESDPQFWNLTWIQPLVANFEKTGDSDTLRVLVFHRKDWASQDTSRLSAALLKFRPILNKETSALDGHQLYEWCLAATEAGTVGDRNLIRILTPALDDKRIVPNPLLQQMMPPEKRVCDWAVSAILTILDGSPDSAFKHAGVDSWEKNAAVRFHEFDRMIVLTRGRLK